MAPRGRRTVIDGEVVQVEAQHWIDAARRVLADEGVDGLRVERLAKTLGITKGSFYWHFKDRAELLDAILDEWRRRATLDIITELETGGLDLRARLMRLMGMHVRTDKEEGAETALRVWARRDERVAAAVEAIDQQRLAYVEDLMKSAGFTDEQAKVRAIFCCSFTRTAYSWLGEDDMAVVEACVDTLLKP